MNYYRLKLIIIRKKIIIPNDQSLWPSEQTIQQLEHHLAIETTMKKGGENAVKVLKQTGAKEGSFS